MNWRYFLFTAIGLAIAESAMAVVACPGPVKTLQPDGTSIEVVLHGDERFNWASTLDGYTLLRDQEGFLTYATRDYNGDLVASKLLPGRVSDAELMFNGIMKNMTFTTSQVVKQKNETFRKSGAHAPSNVQVEASFPSIGKRKLLMLLVNYADTKTTYSQSDFNNYMNQKGYNEIGSFRDYYLENSYGKLDIETTVTRWVTLPHNKSYYGSERAVEMIIDALGELGNEINLSDFDNDHDGVLDGLAVIHQGTGQEASGSTSDIWSHSSVIYGIERDGVLLRRYTIQPEILATTGEISTIGVMCHEFGHNLGAPDFYDTDYSGSGGEFPGTGIWDIMGSGAWNGVYGDRPAGTNMWQKIQLGWVEPVILSETCDVSGMKDATNNPVAYRFDTTVPGEYFILENRQQNGMFDSALPGHGMLVYHVSEERIASTIFENVVNASYPQGMFLVGANTKSKPTADNPFYGNIETAGAPFPGVGNVTVFSDNTTPSTLSISGRNAYKSVSSITESADGKISFHFEKENAPEAPVDLEGTVKEGLVYLTWQSPDSGQDITFTIYRNGKAVGNTKDTQYVDKSPSSTGSITYFVDATYPGGLISPYSQVKLRIPSNKVNAIAWGCVDGTLNLTLDLDVKITRMEREMEQGYGEIEHNVDELDYVHRFRVNDLKVYRGYKIKRVAYLPYQVSKDATYTLRVWEADSDGTNPVVVSEREIKEFGAYIWNQTLLTKAVEITGDKEIWIGLNVKSKVGSVQLLTDIGDIIDGYGNLVRFNGGEWQTDDKATGNYLLYGLLSPPAYQLIPDELNVVPGVEDSELDYVFPVGFKFYRDGHELGMSSNSVFVDKSVTEGLHRYGVSSIYAGGSETSRYEQEIDVKFTSIANVDAEDCAWNLVSAAGSLEIENYEGEVLVVNLYGQVLYKGFYAEGQTLSLPSGYAIVQTNFGTRKILIE